LGRIYQLGQSHYVYRGATHKRLEHSIGTLHVVQRMSDALKNTSKKAKIHQRSLGDALSENHEERLDRIRCASREQGACPMVSGSKAHL
jgi:HD superfamily phosphohydrolase